MEIPIGNVHQTRERYDPVSAAIVIGSAATAGTSIYQSKKAEKRAKQEQAKQEALIAEQEKKVLAEKRKQEAVTQERKMRMQKTQLLTGGETGVEDQPSLLAGA